MKQLDGRVVVVTGGASGIGLRKFVAFWVAYDQKCTNSGWLVGDRRCRPTGRGHPRPTSAR